MTPLLELPIVFDFYLLGWIFAVMLAWHARDPDVPQPMWRPLLIGTIWPLVLLVFLIICIEDAWPDDFPRN